MVKKFEIIKILYHHNRGHFICVGYKGDFDFEIKEGSILEGTPILHYTEMQEAMDNKKEEFGMHLLIFRPLFDFNFPADKFKEGQIVELTIAD